jgi:hypothetical protein
MVEYTLDNCSRKKHIIFCVIAFISISAEMLKIKNTMTLSEVNMFMVQYLFRIQKTGIVDVVVVYSTGPRGWARARGEGWVWKVRVRQLVLSKRPGIRHHEQNIGLPSKWFFFPLAQEVTPRYY